MAKTIFNKANLEINIAEQGGLYNLTEIIKELNKALNQFDTRAMSDYSLFLQGKRAGLVDVISYLNKIQD
jgi:hypothetical protein